MTKNSSEPAWEEVLAISNLEHVHEATTYLIDDPCEDNAVCLFRMVIEEYIKSKRKPTYKPHSPGCSVMYDENAQCDCYFR